MNLAIFGASGGVGREVVSQALGAGHRVTAYVRNAAKLNLTHPDLSVVSGGLTDREAVPGAVAGADAVISALGPSLDRKATGTPLVDGTRTIVWTRCARRGSSATSAWPPRVCATRARPAACSAGSSPSWAAPSCRAPGTATGFESRCAPLARAKTLCNAGRRTADDRT